MWFGAHYHKRCCHFPLLPYFSIRHTVSMLLTSFFFPFNSRQKEYKISNLQTEIDRIMAREKREGGLTPGQAATLAQCEQKIEVLTSEVEDLDETLTEGVRDSVSGELQACIRSTNVARVYDLVIASIVTACDRLS